MFGISMWEIAIIMVLALIVLGPKQLVDVARFVGKLYREVQKMVWEVKNTIDLEAPLEPKEKVRTTPYEPPPEPPKQEDLDELMHSSDHKSGPDFYADLLESSAEEDEEESGASAESEESPSEPASEDGDEEKTESKEGSGT